MLFSHRATRAPLLIFALVSSFLTQTNMEDQMVADALDEIEEDIDYHMIDELQQHNIKWGC